MHPPCACVHDAQRAHRLSRSEAGTAARQARQDQEGTLFLTKRRSHPRFQLIILNKKSGSACQQPTQQAIRLSCTLGSLQGRACGGNHECIKCRADNYKEEVADNFAYEEQNDNYMMYRSKSGEVTHARHTRSCELQIRFTDRMHPVA